MRASSLASVPVSLVLALVLGPTAMRAVSDGVLDPTFGTGGVQKIDWDLGGSKNEYVTALVGDADGALFVVGYGADTGGDDDWYLMKRGESGQLLAFNIGNFNHGGTNNDRADAATYSAGGHLVVAGVADNAGYNDLEVCRYVTSNLGNDGSFGSSGCLGYNLGSGQYFSVAGIAPAGDGGYIVGGTINQSGNRGFFALKVTATGGIDSNFGFFGIRVVQLDLITSGRDLADDLAVDPQGGILLVGRAEYSSGEYLAALVKLTPAGNLDTGFDSDGEKLIGTAGESWEARTVTTDLAASSRFALGVWRVTGTGTSEVWAGEVESNGAPDPFSTLTWDGSVDNFPGGVLLQPNGRPLVTGFYSGSGTNGAVLCANRLYGWNYPQGTFDISWGNFGNACFSPYDAGYGDGFTVGAATLWGGRLVLAGSANGDGDEDWILVRLANGDLFRDGFETGDARMWRP